MAGFKFIAEHSDGSFRFCVDRWQSDPSLAFGLFEYLGLEPTKQIREFISMWPAHNATDESDTLNADSSELRDARRMCIQDREVHPIVEPWARRLRSAGLQPFFESLGYSDLAWFDR